MPLRKRRIKVEVPVGHDIASAIREAIVLSTQERVVVEFDFNEQTVEVDAAPLVEQIYAAWEDGRPSKEK